MGRAPRTKETLPDFREKCRVTRHSRVFYGLTGSQWTPGFGASQATRSSCRGEQLCLLARRDSTVRSLGILERSWASLSKNPSLFSLLFTVCYPKLVGSTWSRELSSHATCPIAIGSMDYTHIPYPSTLGFSSN